MRLKITFVLIFILPLFGCKSNDKIMKSISCSENFELQHDRFKNGDQDLPKANKKTQSFTVYFLNNFNDSIEVFVNSKLEYEKHIVSNTNSDDILNDYFIYNYARDKEKPILKIVSKTKNTCFDIVINKKYKLIYVFLNNEGKWIVRFSNIYYLR